MLMKQTIHPKFIAPMLKWVKDLLEQDAHPPSRMEQIFCRRALRCNIDGAFKGDGMRKVFLYSLLLVGGLAGSQVLTGRSETVIKLLTMFCLSFIMIHVGYDYDFGMHKGSAKKYRWDYVVALTTTVFPWIFCSAYFVFVMSPADSWWSRKSWWEAGLQGQFAAATSVGILFSMLAAAGLSTTWLFKKVRILAIADDVDTILLLIPLKILVGGMKVPSAALILVLLGLGWAAWKYVQVKRPPIRLPITWPWVMLYSAIIVSVSEGVRLASRAIDESMPIYLEVLLPAFILGTVLSSPPERYLPVLDTLEGHEGEPINLQEQRAALIISASFMLLVGLSIPPLAGYPSENGRVGNLLAMKDEGILTEILTRNHQFPVWSTIAIHVLIITVLSNLGKMFPAFCYRNEAGWNERLALAIGMFPRGEVGAGILLVSLSYGIAGPALTVAVLSLAFNLLCTGIFVLVVKRLVARAPG